MRFGVRISSMVWDEAACSWTLTATNGETFCARFVITALGPLSSPTLPAFEGMNEFAGESFHTFRWPDDLDLTGKRVGQIGTGATGIQIVPSIARSSNTSRFPTSTQLEQPAQQPIDHR